MQGELWKALDDVGKLPYVVSDKLLHDVSCTGVRLPEMSLSMALLRNLLIQICLTCQHVEQLQVMLTSKTPWSTAVSDTNSFVLVDARTIVRKLPAKVMPGGTVEAAFELSAASAEQSCTRC